MLQKNEQIELAAKLLKLNDKDAYTYGSVIEEMSAVYVSIPDRKSVV